MKTFEYWLKHFNSQEINAFNKDSSGVLWLKIKSIMRKEILDFMRQNYNINFSSKRLQDVFKEFYENATQNEKITQMIDKILRDFNSKELIDIQSKFTDIESELYKLTYFAWGGDFVNSLDKQIVSYVKNVYKYNEIIEKIDNEIALNVKNYTLSSWYNHWTTILTEYIFKSHSKVISAVGKIKSVDFFIDDVPIDLKITYFPKEFLKLQRKFYDFGNEITLLKKLAKDFELNFDIDATDELLKYQITQQIKDLNNNDAIKQLENIEAQNRSIIDNILKNKEPLIRWLYENQGELRFGAENRIFMILIDRFDFSNSWKLKRNFKLIKPKIVEYLDNFNAKNFKENIINFNFHQKHYQSLADIVFVFK